MKQNKVSNKLVKKLIFISVTIALMTALTLYLAFAFSPEQEKELRQNWRNSVENTFPKQAAEIASSFGLSFYGPKQEQSPNKDPEAPHVVLIHGLDDPGKVWMNLAPALTKNNMTVLELRYPNDQPIVDSARFFYEELKQLRELGINRIAIVGHSMGGLVSREMLTNPQINYRQHADNGLVPKVGALIMVGTPNHGSELARFRLLAEMRDQWMSMVKGQGHILRGILDGAGEAKIDLLPNSQFLQTLNSRPHPEGVDMLVIAGIASPWDDKDISRFITSVQKNNSLIEMKKMTDFEVFLKSMTNGLGDGVVTVDSTRLAGVDHQTVSGTHLSMIRNVSEKSTRTPPSVPLITERLDELFSKP
ncbi:esterase/lipase family protein [Kaarinaea lacus]